MKYSSKQREDWSNIDYFGARYYSNEQFRFTSPDPVMINKERTYKPWLLNLYAYTRNNPMSYVDMDGRVEVNVNIKEYPINYSIEANKTCGSLACVKIMTKGSSTCFKNSDDKWYPNFNIGFNFNVYYWNNKNMKNKYLKHEYKHIFDYLFWVNDVINYFKHAESKGYQSKCECENIANKKLNSKYIYMTGYYYHIKSWIIRDLLF